MPTRRGWLVLVSSVILTAIGRLLGLPELFALAAAAIVLVGAAVVYARNVRYRLDATRELRPPRVHAGTASRVELSVRNIGTRRSPVLTARDPFDGGRRWARFLLAPLAPGETARAAYRLPTERRGVFALGPLQLALHDPFGLAAVGVEAAAATRLTVYPRVDDIPPPPRSRGDDPHAGADHPDALGQSGEDFYALREYQPGDDIRRVHWAATARSDDLMIRQEEMPWQGRATVLVDLRRSVHDDESLELAISAAASVATACWRHRSLVRLVTTGGVDSGFAAGQAHAEAVLEHLAGAQAERSTHLVPVIAGLRAGRGGGALVVATTSAASASDLEGLARLRARYGQVTLVLVERRTGPGKTAAPPRAAPAGLTVVRTSADVPFGPAWRYAVGTRGAVRAPAHGVRR